MLVKRVYGGYSTGESVFILSQKGGDAPNNCVGVKLAVSLRGKQWKPLSNG